MTYNDLTDDIIHLNIIPWFYRGRFEYVYHLTHYSFYLLSLITSWSYIHHIFYNILFVSDVSSLIVATTNLSLHFSYFFPVRRLQSL